MQQTLSAQSAIDNFRANDTIFIPGSCAEPTEFIQTIAQYDKQLPSLHIINSFVPGINTLPLATTENQISETVFFPRPQQASLTERIRFLPLSYYGVKNYLAQQSFDWVVVHVSPPNNEGLCSLGLSVEFIPTVIRQAKRLLAVVNQQMPYVKGSPTMNIKSFDTIIETDSPLVSYDVGEIDPISSQIAEHVKPLITPDAVLQVGLGKVPDKLLSALSANKNLKFHSGMLSDGFLELAKAGALDPNFTHTTCCALGSKPFYLELAELENLNINGVEQTHRPISFDPYNAMISINSALEVDLFGQANLETLAEKQISSVGGAADFARAARNSAKGKSIIALPATASKGKKSRIVSTLSGHVVSLSRTEIDYVVTEYGVAELCNKSQKERSLALIEIAAPEFREELLAQ